MFRLETDCSCPKRVIIEQSLVHLGWYVQHGERMESRRLFSDSDIRESKCSTRDGVPIPQPVAAWLDEVHAYEVTDSGG